MFVELHLGSTDRKLIRLLKALGYGLVALVIGGNDVEELPTFRKLVITRGSAWKIRMFKNFDIVSVVPWSRFVLNKLISDDRVDVITIDEVNRDILPSKAQARVMAREGKALEIVINPIVSNGEAGLAFLRDVINEYSTIDGLRIIVSQGVSKVSDVRNPRDIAKLIEVLTNANAKPLVSDNPYEVLVDALYRRGRLFMRYVVIDVYPREYIDKVISELNNWFRFFAGKDAIGIELRIVAKYEGKGRLIIQVPNDLLKYLRSSVAMAGRESEVAVITVKVTGTMRKALAIASSVPYMFNEFLGQS